MERLQGPIIPCLLGDHFDVEFLEQGTSRKVEEVEEEEEGGGGEAHFFSPGSEHNMPFLQMLQSVETSPFFSFKEPNFQTLLRLQHLQRPWDVYNSMPEPDPQAQAREIESSVTHDMVDLQSPSPVKSESKCHRDPPSNSYLEGAIPKPKQEQQPNSTELCSFYSLPQTTPNQTTPNQTHFSKSSPFVVNRERRKRKRTRPAKNKEEVESQRMTHIAVERNRRRQMNDYLMTLRSLMPSSYIQRGDQASIIGGAIDFVKELEQLLQSLEARKKIGNAETATSTGICPDNVFTSQPQQLTIGGQESSRYCEDEAKVKRTSDVADIEVRTAVQNHVNLKVQCQRRPGQLLRSIIGLEELKLTVLHLNIISSETQVFYSFNLKIEEDCKLGSEDEILAAVHQIFSILSVNGS